MPTTSSALARTLLILPLLTALLAFAADKPAKNEGSFGAAKGSGAYLTRDQLRACMARQEQVKAQDADLLKEQAEIAAKKAEIARAGDEIKTRLETVDRGNAEAVAGYNEALTARDQQIDAFQKRVDAFNARVEANHAEHATFAQSCASRRYFEEDETAIRKGK